MAIATACAKGYGDPCQPGESAALLLKNHGIAFFRFESASSIVYWDGRSRAFERVRDSD